MNELTENPESKSNNPNALKPSELALLQREISRAVKNKINDPTARPAILEPDQVKKIIQGVVDAVGTSNRASIAAGKILRDLIEVNTDDLRAHVDALKTVVDAQEQKAEGGETTNLAIQVNVGESEKREAAQQSATVKLHNLIAKKNTLNGNGNGNGAH